VRGKREQDRDYKRRAESGVGVSVSVAHLLLAECGSKHVVDDVDERVELYTVNHPPYLEPTRANVCVYIYVCVYEHVLIA
jgi:hypothetical protein